MTKDDGGPAFPVLGYYKSISGDIRPQPTIYDGMSLRDWFAGMALQGMCAHITNEKILDMSNGFLGAATPAKAAYVFADAMLKERNHD